MHVRVIYDGTLFLMYTKELFSLHVCECIACPRILGLGGKLEFCIYVVCNLVLTNAHVLVHVLCVRTYIRTYMHVVWCAECGDKGRGMECMRVCVYKYIYIYAYIHIYIYIWKQTYAHTESARW